jgi:outer membrane receptor protein involved in Fe transport
VGINVENERYSRFLEERPFINYQEISLLGNEDDPGQPPTGEEDPGLETFGRILSRLAVPPRDDVQAAGTNWAFYAEDQFKPAQNLTITLGARMDREEIDSGGREPFDPIGELNSFTDFVDAAPTPQDRTQRMNHGWDEFFTGYENIEAFTGQLQEILCEGMSGAELGNCLEDVSATVLSQSTDELEQKRKATNIHIDNTNVSPFISLAWSPWSNGKTAFKASAGRHYNNIPLLIPLQELEPVRTVVEYRASLTDPELCPPPDPGTRTSSRSRSSVSCGPRLRSA